MLRIIAAIVLALATPVAAQDSREMWIRGGILCDTQHDLEVFLTETSLNGGQFPEDYEGSCGRFVPEQPVLMTVTPVEWYELPEVRVYVAHFFHARSMWEQWGYIDIEPNEAVPQGDPA